jgi:hypothetical protein
MQCSIKYDKSKNKWLSIKNNKSKIPNKSKKIFDNIINNIILFNNEIPPFIEKNITYKDWINIKNNTNKWNDIYINNIPNDTIKKLYSEKGCKYIQISEYGLYHLGDDICNFNVPEFIIEQKLRIRIKVHSTKNKNGYCNLSVMASCMPKNIRLLNKSKYSLDDKNKLPPNLIFHNII